VKKLFTKIKWDAKESKVLLRWEEQRLGGREVVKHELESKDKPEPEFFKALEDLRQHALDLMELPTSYGTGFTVSGVSINHEEGDGRVGMVVTCLKAIEQANSPMVLNTPHLRELIDEDTDVGFIPSDMLGVLQRLIGRAERFLDGHREQVSMDLEPAA